MKVSSPPEPLRLDLLTWERGETKIVRAQATRKQVEALSGSLLPGTLAFSNTQLGLNGGAATQFSDSLFLVIVFKV